MNKRKLLPILRLKGYAKQNPEAYSLLIKVKDECGILLENPENLPDCLIKKYNRLVSGSDLPLPIRQEITIK